MIVHPGPVWNIMEYIKIDRQMKHNCKIGHVDEVETFKKQVGLIRKGF